jgi:hypothetical protein
MEIHSRSRVSASANPSCLALKRLLSWLHIWKTCWYLALQGVSPVLFVAGATLYRRTCNIAGVIISDRNATFGVLAPQATHAPMCNSVKSLREHVSLSASSYVLFLCFLKYSLVHTPDLSHKVKQNEPPQNFNHGESQYSRTRTIQLRCPEISDG